MYTHYQYNKHTKHLSYIYHRALNAANIYADQKIKEELLKEMKLLGIESNDQMAVRLSDISSKEKAKPRTASEDLKPTIDQLKLYESISRIIDTSTMELICTCGCLFCNPSQAELEILAGFSSNKVPALSTECICVHCNSPFLPEMAISYEGRVSTEQGVLYSPYLYHSQIFEIIKFKGIDVFFTDEFFIVHHQLFWNSIFYFQLLNLPTLPISMLHNFKGDLKNAVVSMEGLYIIQLNNEIEVKYPTESNLKRETTTGLCTDDMFASPPIKNMKTLAMINTSPLQAKLQALTVQKSSQFSCIIRMLAPIVKDYKHRKSQAMHIDTLASSNGEEAKEGSCDQINSFVLT